MSVRILRLSLGNFFPALLLLLAASVTYGQQMQVDVNSPLPGEYATQQIGGSGFSSYSWYGALRCRQNDAIVGVWIRKGTLVDFMKIECAPLERGARGGITWELSKVYTGGSAGNAAGGVYGRYARCTLGNAISGFKAIYRGQNQYLSDIRFLCSPIYFVGKYSSPVGLQQSFQIKTTQARQYISWFLVDDAIRSYSLGYNRYAIPRQYIDTIDLSPPDQIKALSECANGAAAALSVAVGDYWSLTGIHKVVQAFQMFCYGASVDLTRANPYLDPFENSP